MLGNLRRPYFDDSQYFDDAQGFCFWRARIIGPFGNITILAMLQSNTPTLSGTTALSCSSASCVFQAIMVSLWCAQLGLVYSFDTQYDCLLLMMIDDWWCAISLGGVLGGGDGDTPRDTKGSTTRDLTAFIKVLVTESQSHKKIKLYRLAHRPYIIIIARIASSHRRFASLCSSTTVRLSSFLISSRYRSGLGYFTNQKLL